MTLDPGLWTPDPLTWVSEVELVLIVVVGFVVPVAGVRVVVVLDQRAEEDDEDDLQDDAGDRQLQPHVGGRVRHLCTRARDESL